MKNRLSKKINNFEPCVKLFQNGDLDKAQSCLEKDLQWRNNSKALMLAGLIKKSEGKKDEAIAYFKQSLAIDDKDPNTLNNLGVIYRELGLTTDAIHYFNEALKIARHGPVILNLANLFHELKRLKDADELYKEYLDANPQAYSAWVYRANVNKDWGKFDLAKTFYRQALDINPHYAWGKSCYSFTLQRLCENNEVVKQLDEAIQIDPNNPEIRLTQLINLLPLMCHDESEENLALKRFDNCLEYLSAWAKEGNNLINLGAKVGYSQPYYLAYRPVNHRQRLMKYGSLMSRATQAFWASKGLYPIPSPVARKKIRLAIFSAHICRHSVWDVILNGVVTHLDRNKFEIYIYHTGSTLDAETKRAEKIVDKFVQGPKGHEAWIRQIREDLPDVIYIPEIGMDPYTMQLACLKLAPLQIATWGHPLSTGLPTIDLYLSSEYLESEEAQKHYSEKLIRLPGVGVCTFPLPLEPRAWSLEEHGIPTDPQIIKLLICQHSFKFDEHGIELIAKMMQSAKDTKILLVQDHKYPAAYEIVKNRLRKKFEEKKISYDDLVIEIPWQDRHSFLGMLAAVDIFIDLPSFSGYTTAWQALQSGLPVVTLRGDFLRQRLAAGLLKGMGEENLIATNDDEYIEIVKNLTQQLRISGQKNIIKDRIRKKLEGLNNNIDVVRVFENVVKEELNSKGYKMSDKPQDSMSPKKNVEPWKLLSSNLHIHTLKHDYAPVALLNMIPNGISNVLDIGCFCGGTGKWLKEKHNGINLIGVEPLKPAADIAKKIYDYVYEQPFDQIDLKNKDWVGKVDTVVLADVLEHMYDPWATLVQLHNVIARNGSLYISLPNIRNLNILKDLTNGQWNYKGAGILDITHIRFFTKKTLLNMLDETGWVVEEMRVNPDPTLKQLLENNGPQRIKNIKLDKAELKNLSPDDVLEYATLQFLLKVKKR